MKKTLFFVLMTIIGLSVVRVHADTWTWDPPVPVVKTPAITDKLTELTADTTNDLLYGIAGGVTVAVSTGTPVTPSADPLVSGDGTIRDLTAGFQENVYVITDSLVASWTAPSTYTNLDSQPLIPEGTVGTFKHITTGKDDKLFVLYEVNTDGAQYIIVGNPPIKMITASIKFTPRTLNLKSKGKWVTCRIGLPAGYDVDDIDQASICITSVYGNDKITPIYRDPGSPYRSRRTLMIKFSRQELSNLIESLLNKESNNKVGVELIVSGFGEDPSTDARFKFTGADTISVNAGNKKLK